ncbi:hypothetical protein B0H14DRAFT_3465852 [Mycena olivaceomarginata]|nr:hypothetical protein B0H14DRAFT_3465852 [Mycena olivaceomarginata]
MGHLSAMPHRLHIPSLRSLRITIPHDTDVDFLPAILDFFSTLVLTKLIIHNSHGTQILLLFNSISLPHTSFPVLASLSFIRNYQCQCELGMVLSDTIFALPLTLFPALSSLTLINQCFTADLLEGLFECPQSWLFLQTVILCHMDSKLQAVSDALRFTVDQRHGQALAKFRLDPVLAALENWQEIGADVEVFDPMDILDGFHSP